MAKNTRPSDELLEEFLLVNDGPVTVGIDPGVEGALAFLCDDSYLVLDIPTVSIALKIKNKSGKFKQRSRYDFGLLDAIFSSLANERRSRTVVVLEQVGPRPTDTPVTAFTMGAGYGMFPLYFQHLKLRLEDVTPSVWKRRFNLLGEEKESSRLLAQRLFPNAPLTAKAHHNRAEALLLAQYGRGRFDEKHGSDETG